MEFNLIKILNSFNSGGQPVQGNDNAGSIPAHAVGQKIVAVTDSQTVGGTTASQPNNQLFILPTKQSLLRDVVVAAVSAAVSAIVTILIGMH